MTPKGMDLSWQLSTDSSEESTEEMDAINNTSAEKLEAVNKLLSLDGHAPLNRTLQVSWVDASEKTKRFYTSKMSEVINTVLELVAPNDAGLLWRSLKESTEINKRYEKLRRTQRVLF